MVTTEPEVAVQSSVAAPAEQVIPVVLGVTVHTAPLTVISTGEVCPLTVAAAVKDCDPPDADEKLHVPGLTVIFVTPFRNTVAVAVAAGSP